MPDDAAYCTACGAPLPTSASRVIVKEAPLLQHRYRARWVEREKALYIGVRGTVAIVILLVAVYLILARDCETHYVPPVSWEVCTPIWELNFIGMILLGVGIILLLYSIARTVLD